MLVESSSPSRRAPTSGHARRGADSLMHGGLHGLCLQWSGFEDGSRTPGGCWNVSTDSQLIGSNLVPLSQPACLPQFKIREIVGFLRYWGFNAVRLPVSLDLALNLDAYSSNKIQDQCE